MPPLDDVSSLIEALDHCEPATIAIHADDPLNNVTDVAPPLHVSTTYRYGRGDDLVIPAGPEDEIFRGKSHVYTRYTSPNTSRLEAILGALMKAEVLTYSSGLAAFNALLTLLCPKVLAIGQAYHGCLEVAKLHTKIGGLRQVGLDIASWDAVGLGKGDLVHVETPQNPTGEAVNIAHWAKLAHDCGAILSVDATFGPPGLQDPLSCGADIVMHSGTKYIGGHSDMLCGVLAVRNKKWAQQLFHERCYLGSVMGNMESWLGVRSMRTFDLRVRAQSRNASRLVEWIHAALQGKDDVLGGNAVRAVVKIIKHASLQGEPEWLRKQMPNGYGPVFALYMKTPDLAKRLPDAVHLFHHATSLGGMESLIEWRRMSDPHVDETVIRVSVGGESWEDLQEDLLRGFKAIAA